MLRMFELHSFDAKCHQLCCFEGSCKTCVVRQATSNQHSPTLQFDACAPLETSEKVIKSGFRSAPGSSERAFVAGVCCLTGCEPRQRACTISPCRHCHGTVPHAGLQHRTAGLPERHALQAEAHLLWWFLHQGSPLHHGHPILCHQILVQGGWKKNIRGHLDDLVVSFCSSSWFTPCGTHLVHTLSQFCIWKCACGP